MQFLFVVLMSALVGASALPHLLQAPNRPSFSLRKNTSFSLVAIPKFIEKVVNLERKLASIEKEQIRRKREQELAAKKEASLEEKLEDLTDPLLSQGEYLLDENSESPDGNFESYSGLKGTLTLGSVDLRSCVCRGEQLMDCLLWVEGYCSHENEFIDLVVQTAEGELSKKFRCKELNQFSGALSVSGSGPAHLKLKYLDQKLDQNFTLTNHCGPFGEVSPSDDE